MLTAPDGQERLNEGLAWAHPLESRYGRARRWLIANPACRQLTIRQLVSALFGANDMDSVEAYLNPQLNAGIRQCPRCAQRLFHPAVYGLPGLRQCPIHHIPFTRRCPDCGTPWVRPFTVSHPCCPSCGRPPWETLGRVHLKRAHYRRLQWLNDWLAQSLVRRQQHPPTLLYEAPTGHLAVAAQTGTAFQPPVLAHPYYAAFESQKAGGVHNAALRRLHVLTVPAPLGQRRTRVAQIVFSDTARHEARDEQGPLNTLPPQLPAFDPVLAGLAIRRLLRWQQNALDCHHRLQWCDLRLLRPEQLHDLQGPCLLCLAFSFWCQCLLLKDTGARPVPGGPGEHELCRFADYRAYPQTPQALTSSWDDGQVFRASPGFERWLYLRATDAAFVEFMQLVAWIQACASQYDATFRQAGYRRAFAFRRPPMAAQLLDIERDAYTLTASYWYRSPLSQLLPFDAATRQGIARCRAPDPDTWCNALWSVDPDPRRFTRKELDWLFHDGVPAYGQNGRAYSWLP